MPELIRLQTPDFELSVWANDISQRALVYQTTIANRASLTPETASVDSLPTYQLRFAPEVELLDITSEPTALPAQGAQALHVVAPKKCATLMLNTPLFFENTQYQFEWIFFGAVTNARLVLANNIMSISQ